MAQNRIQELRKKHRMQQSELAEKIGVTNKSISSYETGRCEPTIDSLCKLADFFGTTVDYLLGRDKTDTDINAEIKIVERTISLPKDEQELLDYYRSCSPAVKKYIMSKAMICSIEGLPDQEQKSNNNSESNEGKLLA